MCDRIYFIQNVSYTKTQNNIKPFSIFLKHHQFLIPSCFSLWCCMLYFVFSKGDSIWRNTVPIRNTILLTRAYYINQSPLFPNFLSGAFDHRVLPLCVTFSFHFSAYRTHSVRYICIQVRVQSIHPTIKFPSGAEYTWIDVPCTLV